MLCVNTSPFVKSADLLVPGVLASPLQYVLKKSRLHAAQCYRSLALALTVSSVCSDFSAPLPYLFNDCYVWHCLQSWHEPPAVLKLLLRCLYHLLCATAAHSPSAPASATKRKRQSDIAVTMTAAGEGEKVGFAAQELEQEKKNLASVAIAGEALLVLCSNVDR
jgi:hypothetical protein